MRLTIILLLLHLPVLADEFEWQKQMVKDDITIEVRKVRGTKYREFRAVVDLKAKAAHAVALLQDNAACSQWVHRCVSSEVIEAVSNTERYFHQITSLPFPARSRDAVFHGSIHYEPDQRITIIVTSAHDRLPTMKHVRITEAHGFYHIDPISEDSIRLTWQLYVDPAGALPAFLVNSLVTDLPFQSLSAFRELVKQPPYNQATFLYDAYGAPINISFISDYQSDDK